MTPLITLDLSTAPPASSVVQEKESNGTKNEVVFGDFEGENEMYNIEINTEDVIIFRWLDFLSCQSINVTDYRLTDFA